MKMFCAISIFLVVSCYSPERKCSDFKTGRYKYEALVNGEIQTTIFERNDNIQIESYLNRTDTSKIRWINDCEFILTPLRPESILDQYQIHMKILSTNQNVYKFQYNIVGEDQKETGIAEKLD